MPAPHSLITRWIFWPAAAGGTLIVTVLSLAAWYRTRDHSARLLALRTGEISARESLLADSAGYREISFTLKNGSGTLATGHLRLPLSASGPLPAVLIFGGQRTGARAAGLVSLDQPAVLCAMDYPDIPRFRGRLAEIPGTLYYLHHAAQEAVGMAFSALEYLCSRPEVDPGRVTVLGASFGVPFAAITALDQRVKGLVLIYGGSSLEKIIEWNLRKRIRSGALRAIASWLLGTLVSPYEPSFYLSRLESRPLLMVNSLDDQRIPPQFARKLFLCAQGPKELVWLNGGHIHPSDKKLLDQLRRTISAWLESRGLL